MAKKGNRVQVILECTEQRATGVPGISRYITTKNRKNTTARIELKKYNANLKKVHKEIGNCHPEGDCSYIYRKRPFPLSISIINFQFITMAKKVVATLKKEGGKGFAKIIKGLNPRKPGRIPSRKKLYPLIRYRPLLKGSPLAV